jgi:hypothetical protein
MFGISDFFLFFFEQYIKKTLLRLIKHSNSEPFLRARCVSPLFRTMFDFSEETKQAHNLSALGSTSFSPCFESEAFGRLLLVYSTQILKCIQLTRSLTHRCSDNYGYRPITIISILPTCSRPRYFTAH